jgi:hypothetical protein
MTRRRLSTLVFVAAVALAWASAADAGKKQKTIRLKVGPFPVEAQRNREICKAFVVDGVPGMEVVIAEARSKVSQKGLTGSHHLVVYGYTGESAAEFPDDIVDSPGCAEFGPVDFFRKKVFLSGSGGEFVKGNWATTTVSMPGDLALVMPNLGSDPDKAVIVVNSHYFNGADKKGKGIVKVKMKLEPLEPHKRIVRQVIDTTASRVIDVPPNSKRDVSATWQADGEPNEDSDYGYNPSGDVCVFTLSTHMHERGTRFVVDYESDDDPFCLEDGDPADCLIDWPDYLHPGTAIRPKLGAQHGLLEAYTAENGFPRIRYQCTHANGVDGRPPKMGCEEVPGETPGISWEEGEALGMTNLENHAEPCGLDAANCGGRACVDANLVFGPLSEDEMCILTAFVYDPIPGVEPERACDFGY